LVVRVIVVFCLETCPLETANVNTVSVFFFFLSAFGPVRIRICNLICISLLFLMNDRATVVFLKKLSHQLIPCHLS
jgi:hypothetical protein